MKSLFLITLVLATAAGASSLRNEGHVAGSAYSTAEVTGIGSSYSKSAGTSQVTSFGNYQLAPSGVGVTFSGNVTSTLDAHSFNVSAGGGTGTATYTGKSIGGFTVNVLVTDPYGRIEGGGAIDYGLTNGGGRVSLTAAKNTGIGALSTADLSITGRGAYGGTNTSVTGTAGATQTSITTVNTYGVTVDGSVLPHGTGKSLSEGIAESWVSFVDPR